MIIENEADLEKATLYDAIEWMMSAQHNYKNAQRIPGIRAMADEQLSNAIKVVERIADADADA